MSDSSFISSLNFHFIEFYIESTTFEYILIKNRLKFEGIVQRKLWDFEEKVSKLCNEQKNTCSTHSFRFSLNPCDYYCGSCKRFTKKRNDIFVVNFCLFFSSFKDRNHCFCLLIHKLSLRSLYDLKNRNCMFGFHILML